MAKVKDPLYIKFRSTHGGITLASTHVGLCARSHFVPAKNARFSGKIITSRQAVLMQTWRNFSSAERAAWIQFGIDFPGLDKYGQPIVWSGFNVFCRYASLSYSLTGIIHSSPPDDPVCNFNPIFILSWSGPGDDVRLVCSPFPGPLETVVCLRKLNFQIGVSVPASKFVSYKYIKFVDFPSPIIAYASEISLGGFQQNFLFYPVDSSGRRKPNLFYSLET